MHGFWSEFNGCWLNQRADISLSLRWKFPRLQGHSLQLYTLLNSNFTHWMYKCNFNNWRYKCMYTYFPKYYLSMRFMTRGKQWNSFDLFIWKGNMWSRLQYRNWYFTKGDLSNRKYTEECILYAWWCYSLYNKTTGVELLSSSLQRNRNSTRIKIAFKRLGLGVGFTREEIVTKWMTTPDHTFSIYHFSPRVSKSLRLNCN